MKTTNKTTVLRDRKAMLSLLWIFVMFNFTYADILTLYFNNVLQKEAWKLFQSGTVGSVHITQGFVLLAACRREAGVFHQS
jgi:Family of unknown function (DUF6326)